MFKNRPAVAAHGPFLILDNWFVANDIFHFVLPIVGIIFNLDCWFVSVICSRLRTMTAALAAGYRYVSVSTVSMASLGRSRIKPKVRAP